MHKTKPCPLSKPEWNDKINHKHELARKAYHNWISCDRDKHHWTYQNMVSTRKNFKLATKTSRKAAAQQKADNLALSLHADTSQQKFWQKIRSHKAKNLLPLHIDAPKIAEMWRNYYNDILNSNSSYTSSNNNIRFEKINDLSYMSDFMSTPCNVRPLLWKLSLNRAAGSDEISTEHLIYADPQVCTLLSKLINTCISHGVMPQACIETILVHIYKNNKSNIHVKNNYRPITLATVISKLFEHFILQQISPFLTVSSNQFGFKRKHSTDQCVFLYKQAISYYVNQNSPVFSTFLDASKAFYRVNHKLLFKKLSNRNVPAYFVRLLAYWYSTQCMKVWWENLFSSAFTVSNGVRQY